MNRRLFIRRTASLATAFVVYISSRSWAGRLASSEFGGPKKKTRGGRIMAYEVQSALKPEALKGMSESQINQHWKLYEGYVSNANALRAELEALRKEGKGGTPLYADRRRRFGFEYNGMVLHEYYFGNLKQGSDAPGPDSPLVKAISAQYGSFEVWKDDFIKTGATRSIGWAILYLDPATGMLTNHFIQVHEEGHPAGFVPVLVMDVWEHAYMVDWGAGGRADYMKAFYENVNWSVAAKRYATAVDGKIPSRF
jgi:Fe-Mn family superoxide dismutase